MFFFPSPLFFLAQLLISLLRLYPFHPNNRHFVSGSLSSPFLFFFDPSSTSIAINLNRFRFPACTFPYGVHNLMKVYVFKWLIKLKVILKMIKLWSGFFLLETKYYNQLVDDFTRYVFFEFQFSVIFASGR